MQRWEYRVVSFREGHYTESLNAYGREGWELVGVASEDAAPKGEPARGLPVPGAIGKITDAASKLKALEGEQAAETTSLMWVLRRPLEQFDA
jgi:hypothetical protein